MEGSGNDRRNLCLLPHGKAVFIAGTLPQTCKIKKKSE